MTKQISLIVSSQTGGPGGPAQVAERQHFEVMTSCCARLECLQKVDEILYRALAVKKMEEQNINPLNKSTQKTHYLVSAKP